MRYGPLLTFIGVVAAALTLALVPEAPAQATRPAGTQQFSLTKRQEQGPYGNSAYSFRHASAELTEHRNEVDLVYSNCGLLHINPVGRMSSRVTDLGEAALEAAPDAADENAKWLEQSVKPQQGHVYLQEIVAHDQRSLVKFRVDEAAGDSLKISWVAIELDPPPAPAPGQGQRGRAGTMGLCGGPHQAK